MGHTKALMIPLVLFLSLTGCERNKETVLKSEVGDNRISTVKDMREEIFEDKISTVRMDRKKRDEKERWKYAEQRRTRWVNSALESGFLDQEYTAKRKPKSAEPPMED